MMMYFKASANDDTCGFIVYEVDTTVGHLMGDVQSNKFGLDFGKPLEEVTIAEFLEALKGYEVLGGHITHASGICLDVAV